MRPALNVFSLYYALKLQQNYGAKQQTIFFLVWELCVAVTETEGEIILVFQTGNAYQTQCIIPFQYCIILY